MKKKIFKAIALVGFSCALVQSANAGWVDDWVSQESGSGPSYIQGQERGYYSGGNFSARWQDQTTFPITTTLPHIKSGCGGIDVFMGGFSFMNSQYLVSKLQSILSNAAGVAFDLALKTLCEQCSNTIKNMEALSDTLNHIQMNECAAGKALVATVQDPSSDNVKKELGEAINYDKLSSGASDLWTSLTTSQRAANNVPSTSDTQSVMSGCNASITAIFLKDGLLLANLGAQMGIPSAYTDLMRGLVGDVRLNISQNFNVSYVAPCPQNNQSDLGAVSSGNVYAEDALESCSKVTDANADLTTYALTSLNNVVNDVQNRTAISSTDQAFVNGSPLATIPIVKLAIATSTQSQTVNSLADLTAKALTLQMLSDLYTRTDTLALKAREILSRQNGASAGQKDTKCADATFAPNIDKNLNTMLTKVREIRKAAQDSYNTSATQFATTLQYLKNQEQQEDLVNNIVRKQFGDYAAAAAQKH